jgi:hypothetical protein
MLSYVVKNPAFGRILEGGSHELFRKGIYPHCTPHPLSSMYRDYYFGGANAIHDKSKAMEDYLNAVKLGPNSLSFCLSLLILLLLPPRAFQTRCLKVTPRTC